MIFLLWREAGSPCAGRATAAAATSTGQFASFRETAVDITVTISREKYVTLGAFGRWNVGPWSPEVEAIWEGKR